MANVKQPLEPSEDLDHLDKMAALHAGNPLIREINKQVASLLPTVPKDANILDLGCGAGGISLLLAKEDNVASVVGTDVSEGMIDQANRLLEAEPNPKVTFQLTPRLPGFSSWRASKDLVVMSLVLGHIAPKAAGESVVAAAVSTLKPGGQFALAEFLFVEEEAADAGGLHDHSQHSHNHHSSSHDHHHDHGHRHHHDHGHGHEHHHDHGNEEGEGNKSHHGGHVAYTEDDIKKLFSNCGLKPAPKFIPFEFDWGGIKRKCVMAVGTRI